MKRDELADDNDSAKAEPAPANGQSHSRDGNGELLPVLVEGEGAELSVVWLYARRSELAPGVIFGAHGRRWVITGLSPSGVTFNCRQVPDDRRG